MAKNGEAKRAVKIRCTGSGAASIDQLQPFQGNLKSLSKARYEKLRGLILSQGFSFAPYVWKSPDGVLHLIDGHQRRATLMKLREEGYDIPEIPYTEVKAGTAKEAHEKLLAGLSQFGEIDRAGLHEFLVTNDIDLSYVQSNTQLPDFDMETFPAEFYEEGGPANGEGTGGDPWGAGGGEGGGEGGGDGDINRVLLLYKNEDYAKVFTMAEKAMGDLGAHDMSDLFMKLLEGHLARANGKR